MEPPQLHVALDQPGLELQRLEEGGLGPVRLPPARCTRPSRARIGAVGENDLPRLITPRQPARRQAGRKCRALLVIANSHRFLRVDGEPGGQLGQRLSEAERSSPSTEPGKLHLAVAPRAGRHRCHDLRRHGGRRGVRGTGRARVRRPAGACQQADDPAGYPGPRGGLAAPRGALLPGALVAPRRRPPVPRARSVPDSAPPQVTGGNSTSTARLPRHTGGSCLNGLNTVKPGRSKSLSFPVTIVRP